MGTRSGGSGGLGGGRAAGTLPGGGTPPPDDGREPTWREKQKMIAGYQTLDEAREGGKRFFASYNLDELQTVGAHQAIQSTLIDEARIHGIDLKDSVHIAIEKTPGYAATSQTGLLWHGKKNILAFNPQFYDHTYNQNMSHMALHERAKPREAIVSHEFAHLLQTRRTSYQTYIQMRNSPPIHPKSRLISQYSQTNRLEEHAEAYASLRHGNPRGKIAARISREVLNQFPDERPKGVRNRRKKTGLD